MTLPTHCKDCEASLQFGVCMTHYEEGQRKRIRQDITALRFGEDVVPDPMRDLAKCREAALEAFDVFDMPENVRNYLKRINELLKFDPGPPAHPSCSKCGKPVHGFICACRAAEILDRDVRWPTTLTPAGRMAVVDMLVNSWPHQESDDENDR